MKAIISRTRNGAGLSFRDKLDPEFVEQDFSYQFDAYSHDGDSMQGLAEMLWEILELMGWSGDRRDRERIQIRLVHGDRFEHSNEDPKKGCRICQDNPTDALDGTC
jgi:hypothetical protein